MSQVEVHVVFQVLNFIFSDHPVVQEMTEIEKLLLTCLARHHGKLGICPSIARLSEQLHLSKWPIQRAIQALEQKSLLTCVRNNGCRSRYNLHIPCPTGSSLATSSQPATGSSLAPKPVAGQHQTGSWPATRYNPLSNPVTNPEREKPSLPVDNFQAKPEHMKAAASKNIDLPKVLEKYLAVCSEQKKKPNNPGLMSWIMNERSPKPVATEQRCTVPWATDVLAAKARDYAQEQGIKPAASFVNLHGGNLSNGQDRSKQAISVRNRATTESS